MADANKEASGKAVMMGPGAMGDTKERSLKIRGKGAEDSNYFRDGEDSIFGFSFNRSCGVRPRKGKKFLKTRNRNPK